MARARNIKPGVFKNEVLVELTAFTRLLFIGLWTMADREGRLEDRPKRIKLELFPYDSDDIDSALDSLASGGFISRYESSGIKVISIDNFLKHQNPHGTEKDSELPDVNGSLTERERDKRGYATGVKRVNNVKSSENNVKSSGNNVHPPEVNVHPLGDHVTSEEVNVHPVCNNALIPDSLIPDSLIPDTSVPKGTGDKSPDLELPTKAYQPATPEPMDDKDKVFKYGVPILVNSGSTDKAARSFLGGLCKQHGDSAVVDSLRHCIRAKPLQPIEWLAKALPPKESAKAKPGKHSGFSNLDYREGVHEDGSFA
jgi:hypothetical protein